MSDAGGDTSEPAGLPPLPPVPDFTAILGVDAAAVHTGYVAHEQSDAAQDAQDRELAAALTDFSDSMVARDQHLREYAADLELRVKSLQEELTAARKRADDGNK